MRSSAETPLNNAETVGSLNFFPFSLARIFLLCIFAGKTNEYTAMIGTRSTTDLYMVVLATLSNSDKLDLIAKLSNSMREEADVKRKRPNLRTCFKGNWNDVDADSLRNHEYHGRTIERW